MSIRVGINGFGRIGRNFYRAARDQGADLDVVAVNDLGSIDTMAHLLSHDSVHGRLGADVSVDGDVLSVGNDSLQVLSVRNPEDLPWGDLGVDVVVESTGIFTKRDAAARHLDGGAPRVLVSAPCSGADATFVVGVNDSDFDPVVHTVVSNASCTTNCFVPMVKVLDDAFGVERGLMTTVHAYTGDQALVDGPHSDLRRARGAAVNIVPTSTGAARATGLVLQAMQGRLDGISLRVPIPDGSITDFTAKLAAEPSVDQVNQAFAEAAADGPLAGVLDYSEAPLVSADIVGSPASCVFDSGLTMAMGDLVKINGWYDNEWGYSNRLVDMATVVGSANR
ncbi:MAG: type I glyceraldehyde-3-phosphate dehydrogenase [Acidimicrobiia bacterium]|nr:type I glyceraldehyde-3-phosphate dehydrogenase [Acidimicrobiia bacterium]